MADYRTIGKDQLSLARKFGNRPRGRARPDSAKPTSRPKLLAQNRLVAKRSGAPKRSEGGLDSGPSHLERARFPATILFRWFNGEINLGTRARARFIRETKLCLQALFDIDNASQCFDELLKRTCGQHDCIPAP